jgi:predicted GNAT family acetyltransferase
VVKESIAFSARCQARSKAARVQKTQTPEWFSGKGCKGKVGEVVVAYMINMWISF